MKEHIFVFYDDLLAVIDFIVSRTSDTLAGVMIRALPLLAPLPNAVSIFYITQHALQYNTLQAVAVAGGMECMFFALTEVALKLWDWVGKDKRYAWPLGIMMGVFVGYFALVMWLVATLEVKQGNLAPLAFPIVSVVAAITLGCERWHKRNQDAKTTQPRNTQKQRKSAKSAQPVAQSAIDDAPVIALPSEALRVWNMRQNGMTIPQIAQSIGKSERTVNNRLRDARVQLNGHAAEANS